MDKTLVEQCRKVIAKYGQCDDEYDVACFALAHALTPTHREVLEQLVMHGPVYDGDIVSKSKRDDLMDLGLAQRVCVKGEQGFTGANYVGWQVHKAMATPPLAVVARIFSVTVCIGRPVKSSVAVRLP